MVSCCATSPYLRRNTKTAFLPSCFQPQTLYRQPACSAVYYFLTYPGVNAILRLLKGRIIKWVLIAALLTAAVGLFVLWQKVDTQVQRVLQPTNQLYVGYADLPEKTLGVQLLPFEVTGWDNRPIQACIVRRTENAADLTPRQLALMDQLVGVDLKDLAEFDFALVCADWDHGIRSALPLAEELAAAGITCVLWEPRGKNSARPWCTYGLQESRDIPFIINALEKQTGRRDLLLAGVGKGFGAGLMLQGAAVEPRLRCVVAQAPIASMSKLLKRAHVSTIMRELIGIRMNWLTGLEPFDIAAVKSAANIRREVPVLIVYAPAENTAQEDAVAIYTQLRCDDKRFITPRNASDAPDAETRTIIYSPDGGTREVQQRVEVDLVPQSEHIPVEMLRWLNAQVRTLQDLPAPARLIPTNPSE